MDKTLGGFRRFLFASDFSKNTLPTLDSLTKPYLVRVSGDQGFSVGRVLTLSAKHWRSKRQFFVFKVW